MAGESSCVPTERTLYPLYRSPFAAECVEAWSVCSGLCPPRSAPSAPSRRSRWRCGAPDAGDIDSWSRWYACFATAPVWPFATAARRGSPIIVARVVLSFHVLVPLPGTFSADYQRQLAEIGITTGCLCDKRLSCWHILLYTIVKRGEGCVPQAADMRLAVRFLSHEPSLFPCSCTLPFRVRHNVAKRLVQRNRCCRRCAPWWVARPGSPAGTVLLR